MVLILVFLWFCFLKEMVSGFSNLMRLGYVFHFFLISYIKGLAFISWSCLKQHMYLQREENLIFQPVYDNSNFPILTKSQEKVGSVESISRCLISFWENYVTCVVCPSKEKYRVLLRNWQTKIWNITFKTHWELREVGVRYLFIRFQAPTFVRWYIYSTRIFVSRPA